MDPKRFDSLARSLGSGQSRRGILKTLAGGALASITAAAGIERAEAAKLRSVGNACTLNADCASGLCVEESRSRKICHCTSATDCPAATGDCHSAICSAGVCGFSINAGAPCDDGDACTTGDVCQANGVCAGSNLVVCPDPDQCHTPGTCDPQTGQCSNPIKDNGTVCNDGDACTQTDTCQDGTCVGSNPVDCQASACQTAGTCDPATGQCNGVPAASGTACGAPASCTGGAPGSQHAQDQCNDSGVCVPGTDVSCGLYVCNGTTCLTTCASDGDCVAGALCTGGVCASAVANGQSCTGNDDCQSGFCNAVSGICCSEDCANGVACTGDGFTCAGPACGAVGQTCCASDVCDSGASCSGGMCVASLANGADCSAPGDCQSGFCNATSGFCCSESCAFEVSCGGAGFTCDPDATCGQLGNICCENFDNDEFSCNDNVPCSWRLFCEYCGSPGEVCCVDPIGTPGVCDDGSFCDPSSNNSNCVACGGSGETCCPSDTPCEGEMICNARTLCAAECGHNGEACCFPNVCDAGLTCDFSGAATCVPSTP